ncbi:peptidase S8/S53 domain-containing protein [Lophiotrema nucula]|uniref:Peptidase S8/S53 domain-containing protein n=1 Tax=Lophiotrema nucula TaxID=690887 RepID=A0A6A5ZXG2_9PLEO|nr:peptidase S8/S53 domain-containing protein [Lophiotrema nucula]
MVASKAVGHWGTAKDATLVPVQITPLNSDVVDAFNVVFHDILRRKYMTDIPPEAVVVMSTGIDNRHPSGERKGFTRDEAERLFLGQGLTSSMQRVLDQGVPIVLASGNYGDQPNRDVIDLMPQVLENDDFPIINVGATTLEGKPWLYTQGKGSQDGTQLTVYAVGENVDVHNHVDGDGIKASGTSYAAPAVAGIIAIHMNYEPWGSGKTGIDKVKEIKKWLRTDESSWERVKPDDPNMEVKMIWTGADKAAHDQANGVTPTQPTPAPAPPVPENEGQTLVVGLQQDAIPNCITTTSGGGLPITSCTDGPDYLNHYFFYRLDHITEVDSLCKTPLLDYVDRFQPEQGDTRDEKLFENPTWPSGQWPLTLNGEQFTYMNDGQTAGALWKGDRRIDCVGDLTHHGELDLRLTLSLRTRANIEKTLNRMSGAFTA